MRPVPFHALSLQLLEPPPAIRAALTPAALLHAPVSAPRATAAISIARRWLDALLRPALAPPPEVPFLAFATEAGRADVVRSAFGEGPLRIETAQTRYLIAVAVQRDVNRDEPVELRAEAAAVTLFQTDTALAFRRLGEDETGVYGERRGLPAVQPVRWPHWRESMWFWVSGARVGFIMLRASGGATRELISADEGLNRIWFDPT